MPSDLRQERSAVAPHAGICAGGAGQPASLPGDMKLCQIGCGEHARVAHGPSQARCARGARRPRARRLLRPRPRRAPSPSAATSATRRAFTDPAAMLDAERPDAVVVVVPVERTVAVGSLVLERGLPLLAREAAGRDGGRGRPADRRRRARRARRSRTRSPSTAASPRSSASCAGGSRRRGRCSTSTTR